MIYGDLLLIGKVYLISLALQLVGWPLTQHIFSKLPDKGWPTSRLLTTLIICLLVWELGNLGLPVNTNVGFSISLALVMIVNFIILWYGKREKLSKETLKLIAVEEYLFLVGFVGITLVRGFLPNIDSLEKYMDFGFINRYLNSPILPAMDMWQAGKAINYYSFGHFWGSGLIRFFMVEPTVGYNLVLGFIAGLALALAFCISHLLSGAKKGLAGIVGGLVGAMTTVLAGNTHVIWYLLSQHSLNGYWYADATRFIHNTIHEFPGYSFVVADLHGHVFGLPIDLLFILIFILWLKNRQVVFEVMMGILFGVMMMTNTWDVAIYGMVLLLASLQIILTEPKTAIKLFRSAGIMAISMGLTALPWLLTFIPISSGIRMVTTRSPLWQLAVLWTGGIIIAFLGVITEGKKENKLAVRTLALSIVLLILIPEIVYAKDIYPDHPRANTMFKLTYQASIMIGLLAGAVWGKLLDQENSMHWVKRGLGFLVAVAIFGGTMIFPTESFPNFYENFTTYKGLDGAAWIKAEMPEEFGAIAYLKEHGDNKNMVEAVGDSYTKLNTVSVFSAVPTIEGWRVHEWLWRGGFEPVAAREAEVKEVYESQDPARRMEILKKYNIGWILVGGDEREKYKIYEKGIKSAGEVVYKNGMTYLVKVK